MIPNKILRKDIKRVKDMVKRRGLNVDFGTYEEMEEERRSHQVATEAAQMESNTLSKEVAVLKRSGQDASPILEQLAVISKDKKAREQSLKILLDSMRDFELSLPNLLDERVPEGKTEADNQEISKHGDIPNFDFEVKSHTDLAGDALDFSRAAKMSGSRFVVMKGRMAKLHRALAQWMLDTQVESGYEEVNPPVLVEHHALVGTGQLPKFADDQFFTEGQHALIPTAEVSVTNLHREEILPLGALPIAYSALTLCFRKEAGAYGKDTHGLIRLHQFEKVELVKFVSEATAQSEFEALITDAEYILQQLQLPYRKVLLCAGDTSASAKITYDLEVWLPGENQYREISSCSYFGDYQARRMQARYRDEDGNVQPLHTINGSGLAVGRALVAVIENYQLASGKIAVPDVLKPYLGMVDEI